MLVPASGPRNGGPPEPYCPNHGFLADRDEETSYSSPEVHGTDRLTDFINEGGIIPDYVGEEPFGPSPEDLGPPE